MPPSRWKGKERASGLSQQVPCDANRSSSSLMMSSSDSSRPRKIREFTLQRKLEAKASITKGGSGSNMTSTFGTLSRCACTPRTLSSQQGDLYSREASSPPSISLSTNYFDVLSKEGDAEPVREPSQAREAVERDREKARAPCRDPKGKAPMSPQELETEHQEDELQRALHLSLMEAERTSRGKERQRSPEPRNHSWTTRPTTCHANGWTTWKPPPTSSRTPSPETMPPRLTKKLAMAKKTLPRSLVPCKLVPRTAPSRTLSPRRDPHGL